MADIKTIDKVIAYCETLQGNDEARRIAVVKLMSARQLMKQLFSPNSRKEPVADSQEAHSEIRNPEGNYTEKALEEDTDVCPQAADPVIPAGNSVGKSKPVVKKKASKRKR